MQVSQSRPPYRGQRSFMSILANTVPAVALDGSKCSTQWDRFLPFQHAKLYACQKYWVINSAEKGRLI